MDVSDFMPDVAALRSLAVAQKDIEVLGALGEGTRRRGRPVKIELKMKEPNRMDLIEREELN